MSRATYTTDLIFTYTYILQYNELKREVANEKNLFLIGSDPVKK